MSFTFIQHFIILGISAGVVFFYVQPQLLEVRDLQSEISQYNSAVENASAFNQELSQLLNQADTLTRADQAAIERFLPESVDRVGIARDIQTIAQRSGMIITSIGVANEETDLLGELTVRNQATGFGVTADAEHDLLTSDFPVAITGTYTNFKRFLAALEQNAYPLSVVTLSVTGGDALLGATEPLLSYSLTLRSYERVNTVTP